MARGAPAAVLHAATVLLRHTSSESVQVEDVVRRAGIGRATFYCYFASKEELIAACFAQAVDLLDARLKAAAAAAIALLLGGVLAPGPGYGAGRHAPPDGGEGRR